MKDWTHTGAYVAAFALLAIGAAGVACGLGWHAVAACALAVLLLAAFRLAEHRSDVRDAMDVRGRLGGVVMEVERLRKAQEATEKNASTALQAAAELRNSRQRGPGF